MAGCILPFSGPRFLPTISLMGTGRAMREHLSGRCRTRRFATVAMARDSDGTRRKRPQKGVHKWGRRRPKNFPTAGAPPAGPSKRRGALLSTTPRALPTNGLLHGNAPRSDSFSYLWHSLAPLPTEATGHQKSAHFALWQHPPSTSPESVALPGDEGSRRGFAEGRFRSISWT